MKPTVTFQDWCVQNQAYLLLRFYQEGNNQIAPEKIGFSSGKQATFRCHICGLSWMRTLNKATRIPVKQACPFCEHQKPSFFYNLATEYPELKAEWDNKRNPSPPEAYLPKSKRSVYWHCIKNHRWAATICDRVKTVEKARRSGRPICPYCSGERVSATYNLITEHPEVAREWDYIKNAGQKPEDFSPHSNYKAWWICSYSSSHQWNAKISNRTSLKRGCPLCAKEFKMSYPARVLFYYLRQACPDCVCEEPFLKYKMDIFLPSINVVIEHDGYYYHSGKASKERAGKKDAALHKSGLQVLRVSDSKDLSESVIIQKEAIIYRYDERNQYLDHMIAAVFRYLGLKPVNFDHQRDLYEINQLYYHERKKRTLAVEYHDLAKEWSSKNKMKPDTVLSGSSRKVWWHCQKCEQEYPTTVVNRTKNRSNCPFCANLQVYEGNCLAMLRPEIAFQWYPTLNAPFTPHDVVPGSEKEAYWKCSNGHVWKARICSRTSPRCPACEPYPASPAKSSFSLQALNPALAKLWHPTRNMLLMPDDVTAKSNRKVWWQCEKGHEWQAVINKMQKIQLGRYCPYCHDRAICADNSLLTRNPELAHEWDYERNFPLTPDQVLYCSSKKYWWKRGEFSWQASVKNRQNKGDCIPRSQYLMYYQHLRLSATHPELEKQWDYTKNVPLTPDQVTAKSTKVVWWRCDRGHEWKTAVSKRIRGDNCPYCSGHRPSKEYCLQAVYPMLAAQWHPEKNGNLTAWDVTPASGRRVWWRCNRGHEWQTSVSNRSRRGHDCPFCADRTKKRRSFSEELPALAKEWHSGKNVKSAHECPARSNKKVWWKCSVCGNEWQASPDSRFSGSGCPVCGKGLRRIF